MIIPFIHIQKSIVMDQKHIELLASLMQTDQTKWPNTDEACDYLRISISKLFNLRKQGEIPYSKVGRKVMYKEVDLNPFIHRNYTQ